MCGVLFSKRNQSSGDQGMLVAHNTSLTVCVRMSPSVAYNALVSQFEFPEYDFKRDNLKNFFLKVFVT